MNYIYYDALKNIRYLSDIVFKDQIQNSQKMVYLVLGHPVVLLSFKCHLNIFAFIRTLFELVQPLYPMDIILYPLLDGDIHKPSKDKNIFKDLAQLQQNLIQP